MDVELASSSFSQKKQRQEKKIPRKQASFYIAAITPKIQ